MTALFYQRWDTDTLYLYYNHCWTVFVTTLRAKCTGLHNMQSFCRAMLCMRGTIHGTVFVVSVYLSVCVCVCHKSVFY